VAHNQTVVAGWRGDAGSWQYFTRIGKGGPIQLPIVLYCHRGGSHRGVGGNLLTFERVAKKFPVQEKMFCCQAIGVGAGAHLLYSSTSAKKPLKGQLLSCTVICTMPSSHYFYAEKLSRYGLWHSQVLGSETLALVGQHPVLVNLPHLIRLLCCSHSLLRGSSLGLLAKVVLRHWSWCKPAAWARAWGHWPAIYLLRVVRTAQAVARHTLRAEAELLHAPHTDKTDPAVRGDTPRR
jgi:hypothetical protein